MKSYTLELEMVKRITIDRYCLKLLSRDTLAMAYSIANPATIPARPRTACPTTPTPAAAPVASTGTPVDVAVPFFPPSVRLTVIFDQPQTAVDKLEGTVGASVIVTPAGNVVCANIPPSSDSSSLGFDEGVGVAFGP